MPDTTVHVRRRVGRSPAVCPSGAGPGVRRWSDGPGAGACGRGDDHQEWRFHAAKLRALGPRARRMMRFESRSRRAALATPDIPKLFLSEDEMRHGGFEVQ